MATDTRKSTTDSAPKTGATASPRTNEEARPGAERAGKQQSADPAKRAKPPTQQPRKTAQKPKRQPYHVEITALADNTAELPSPVRERAIQAVRALVGLFGWVWRELRRRIAHQDTGEELAAPDDAGPPERD